MKDLIGLMTGENPNLLVGLLGILKAGCGFVPIDPAYPLERINFIVNDCGIEILVTESRHLEQAWRISENHPALRHIICLDDQTVKKPERVEAELHECRDWLLRHSANEELSAKLDETVYVIYTSGSTGHPKGVPISHRNLLPLLLWSKEYFGLGEHTRVLQNLSYCFDFGVFEILTTLLFGGTLYFPGKDGSHKLSNSAAFINEYAINTIHTTPSFFREIISPGARLDSLKILHLGGEQLTKSTVDYVFDVVGDDCELHNGYGPTEASVNCSIMRVGRKSEPGPELLNSAPIGRVTANNQLYVLDKKGRPVPLGVAGELHVGGPGLASGYLNRSRLTAEKFIPNAFVKETGARLYQTGDLVRYRPDANIEFLGRLDDQVKVRGYRIELGEIESALAEHPLVHEAVVMPHDSATGARRLIAYVVDKEGQSTTTSALRSFLKKRLPEYMLPSAFVKLEALPLTSGGKIERRALPAPDQSRPELEETFVTPRSSSEEIIAGICGEVLGIDRVGVHDNLFDLGCHSLLATKIVARLRDTLGVELALTSIFESPTVAELAIICQDANLEWTSLQLPPIQLAERNNGYLPLSFAQERVWFLDQLTEDNISYCIPRALRIKGNFNAEILESTFTELVRRHEILRTGFPDIDGQPVQIIYPPQPFKVTVIDLKDIDGDKQLEVQRLILAEGQKSFELGQPPLLRVTLLRIEEHEHVLVLTEHHLVHDGWTQGVLLGEFLTLYAALEAGKISPLPDLPVQYADFAVWQRSCWQGELVEAQLSYWKNQLAGAPALLELPTDRPRPPVQSFRGTEQRMHISSELAESLRALSRQESSTLFMTMLAAFKVLLSRYAGQDDIVVGTGIANRRCLEIEGMLGMIINTVVMRTDLSGDITFREVLKRVRKVCLEAYAHQDMPFEKLVEELHPQRSLSYMPLFQVMFGFLDTPMRNIELPGLDLELMYAHNRSAKFDLNLVFILHAEQRIGLVGGPVSNEITGLFEYNTDIFNDDTISRMIGHYQTLLKSVVTNPEKRISELQLLTAGEQQQLLVEWNDTETSYPEQSCIHELFEAQVARTPQAVAVVYEAEQLSYEELNRRANQVANYLRKLGVGPESLVAVMLERSVELVVALLGVLKAGGAYVPLDPTYPVERLSFMVADANIALLVTVDRLFLVLPEAVSATVRLDTDWTLIAGESTANPLPLAGGANLAYLIYTSGSSGTPKGAMLTHQGVLNCLNWMQQTYQLDERDAFLMRTSLNFDPSVWEVFWPLMVGARVVIAHAELQLESSTLLTYMAAQEVTCAYFVPSLLGVIAADPLLPSVRSLRYVISGGEQLPVALMRQFHGASGAELHHSYGPTETSIAATEWTCPRGEWDKEVPMGRAIGNTQLYVLDGTMTSVPVGVAGELYIGGAGVGRGYVGEAGMTAERFVPDRFSRLAGGRLYRTGDVVKYAAEGNLVFLGRVDEQVKLRGYRIELGEIETVLRQQEGVREAVVLMREEARDKRLVAYVVGDSVLEVGQLHKYLKQRLPEYMIPSAFVTLDQLPLLPNGKVDRRALPEPEQNRAALGIEYAAPRTPIEEILVNIWSAVLGVEQVGIHDNFFDLGGHSLLATQVISRVRQSFAIEVPLRSLFEHTSLKALATHVEMVLRADQGLDAPPLRALEREGDLPLSFAQQRLWFIDQLEPGSATYNIATAVRLAGVLDAAALERALSEVVWRHEALRTTFPTVDSLPVQRIAAAESLAVPLRDLVSALSGASLEERQQEAQRLAGEEAQQPFKLATGPLLRAQLLRVAAEEHVVLVTMHHIISDGWSMGLLVREVAALYAAYSSGQESPLAELPVQYGDYAVWQREWLSGAVLERELSYWREQLAGAPPVLELPTDHPRPAVQTFGGAGHSFRLSETLTAGLKVLSRRAGATLFMTLLAAFKVLLYRYSGQASVVVGTPIAGRTQVETERLIGFFVNTLVLRTEVSGELSFAELLQRVKEVALGAYAHQEVPFEKLVEELEPQRSLSHTPLFQVMFVMENQPQTELELRGLELSGVRTERVTAKFDLMLQLTETEAGLSGNIEYSTDLYEPETIARLLGHYQTVLESVVRDAAERISELQLLTAGEEEQLLVEWNDTAAAYAEQLCVHELFEAQVERTPNALALVYEAEQLSYEEVNRRANQLAHHLRKLGVGVETLVAVMLERSAAMVIALLAVLKAGAAYVPVDPQYPRERVRYMLEDCGARVVLTQSSLAGVIESMSMVGCAIVKADSDWELIAAQSEANLSGVSAENLAYVIYTSGSTGQPKGVAIQHRSTVAFIHWASEAFERIELEAVLASTSICFDLSVFELFVTLSVGGKVLLTPNALHLPALPSGVEVTLINTVPSVMAELVRAGGAPQSALTVNLAGEPLTNTLAQQIYRECSVERVLNLYGPTEATTYSTFAAVAKGSLSQPTIGRPIANTQAYVLDSSLKLLAVNITGELYIGGAGVARGYLHRAALTAERFLPDPFSRTPGKRLYRTGDMARYCASGDIEFLGRVDQQVKLRGFRIELGEIEVALHTHPSVREGIVIVCDDAAGEKRLVGYVVTGTQQPLTTSELRSFLKEKLPEYMIPTVFVRLEQLPLTSNGKLDRKALPVADAARPSLDTNYQAPLTEFERAVAEIWRDVLHLEQIGIHDNFFELGGHSLLATQVISRLRHLFSIDLPLRRLFEEPSIAALAKIVEVVIAGGEGLRASPLLAVAGDGDLPLSFAQQRLWFIDQLEPHSATYNLASAVNLSGALDIGALERALSEVVRRHEVLRTTFPTVDSLPVQRIAEARGLELPLLDLSGLAEAEREVERLAGEEAQQPFELATGPLLRAQLLRVAEEEHVVLVTMHHIISDGWSMGLLVREVAALYAAYSSGQESALAELPVQYGDYAVWQREWLSGAVLERELSYWREQLAGAPPVLELPADYPRPAVQTFHGANHSFQLSESLTAGLKGLSRRAGATLFMTLLAAFKVLLWRYSGQGSVVVGTPIAGRTQVEVEELIGFFVNTLVLRTEVSGELSFAEMIGRVKEVALGAYAHQEVPFEKLVEELEPQRSLSHTPLFQVMFVMQNELRTELGMSGLQLSGVRTEQVTAKFDLMLQLTETAAGLSGAIEYSTDLYEAETIARMLGHFQALLESVVRDPAERISELQLLTEGEEEQLLVEWNDTASVFAEQRCVHELFEAQAERTPDAVALIFEAEQLSYEAVNRRANQLAHHLGRLGVGTETLVAVMLERSAEMVIALLAVLKAGGAYVPVDPQYPRERVRYMLEDCGARVLLTQSSLATDPESMNVVGCAVVKIDSDWELIAAQSEENVTSGVSWENLAYVIYTSGSTGKPKGVAIQHCSTAAFIHWATEVFERAELETVLASTSICFDLSIFELFVTLSVGGKILLAADALHASLPTGPAVTLLNTVPSAMTELVRAGGVPASVRTVNLAGEPLQNALAQQIYQECNVDRVLNLYGPTEATTYSTFAMVQQGALDQPTIGRPITNTQAYVLDSRLKLVPVNITGELYIGGAGVARGYLHQAGLTAERFIPDPFSRTAGERLYRTGDMARLGQDGKIEYLGRADGQVKIRGYRIELGEIETALSRHDDVRAAVVLAQPDEAQEMRLIAYVVAADAAPVLTMSTMRKYLGEKLPHFMIPGALVLMDELPLTPNGKVDRRALAAPEQNRGTLGTEYAPPVTAVEEILVNIWSEVLRVEQVGIHDNFFDLGGHSLLATQVISRISQTFQAELPLRRLFEQPTISVLAAAIEESHEKQTDLIIPRIPTARRKARSLEQLLTQVTEFSDVEVANLLRAKGSSSSQDEVAIKGKP